MAAAELDCRCGHPQSQHAGGRRGCRNCDLGCSRFEPDEAAAAAERTRVLEAVATVCASQADQARMELGQQPTSARLQLVEAELSSARQEIAACEAERAGAQERLAEVEHERDELARAGDRLQQRLDEFSDLFTGKRAELEEMRRSRDHHRRRGDQAHAQLDDLRRGRDEAVDRALELAAELERVHKAGDAIVSALAQHCPPCRWTGGRHEPHPHPTEPVRVVIHRTEGVTT
jgi:chromosome segregation ATPase